MTGLEVRRVGPESADVVLEIVRDAFGSRPPLNPPADALMETRASIATRLALGGGLLARVGSEPVGCVLLDLVGDTMYLRRFGVASSAQGKGVAGALIQAAVEAATGRATRLSVVAREELPRTVSFWAHRGFTQIDRRSPYVELGLRLPKIHKVPTAADMKALGRSVAHSLQAGDLVVLTGDLGAGKTTFTQGLGAGLGVEGPITSPTFVIAREHTSPGRRPGLVHVDAYRLGGAGELDDLDLDTSLDDVVTVVEWGEGLAETLAPSRLEIRIRHDGSASDAVDAGTADGAEGAEGSEDDTEDDREPIEPRVVEVQGIGPRWATESNRPYDGAHRFTE